MTFRCIVNERNGLLYALCKYRINKHVGNTESEAALYNAVTYIIYYYNECFYIIRAIG